VTSSAYFSKLLALSGVLLLSPISAAFRRGQDQTSKAAASDHTLSGWVSPSRDAFTDSKHLHRDFENKQIRVLRFTLEADESVPMHRTVDTLLVCIKSCHLRLQQPDGHIHDVHMNEGESRWLPSDTRSEKNIAGRPLEIISIEIKSTVD